MATTTNFGWTTPNDTDLVKDGAAAIRTALNGVDTSFVDLKGGTTGQVLAKASNTDLDYSWVAQDDSNAIQNAIVDAKGDLIAATANDTPARLAVGTNGQVLTADSTTATGLKWAAVAAGGKVLQVVSGTYATATTNTALALADSGLSLSITPTSATSKILVMITQPISTSRSSDQAGGGFALLRGATNIFSMTGAGGYAGMYIRSIGGNTSMEYYGVVPFTYLDSPATTSATTYKTQISCYATGSGGNITAQSDGATSSIILMEIGA